MTGRSPRTAPGEEIPGTLTEPAARPMAAARPAESPSASGPATILGLQASGGNQMVNRLLAQESRTHAEPTAHSAGRTVLSVQRVPERADVGSRYDFSTRCGWIDWGHASPGLPANLIDRVRQASNAFGATPQQEFSTPDMTSTAAGVILSSASVQVRLLRALSADEVLQVSLAIFKQLSLAFETQQQWTDLIGSSSFSQEDLPSNLIGFYMAARGFTRTALTPICGVVPQEAALTEFDRRHDFRRNRDFTPIGATEPWPAELSTIDSDQATGLFEVTSISVRQGTSAHRLAPAYRVVGTVGETDLFILSWGGKTFTEADDLQVKPTYGFHEQTSGRHGHVVMIEVMPNRPQDAALFHRHGLQTPMLMPEPVLVGLSAH
ncbi:hypothetical protein JOF56_007373 [Kibdelosporangium banguiense]|uniref:Uncharacterized protein n=1 Tax=Kibdelosporangium banguiense TaxID=1365924 RepID=A0ABS4TRF7_9PSEU|nr:hypothetical protein [Kibdelosporangium banguiense]MBP2326988.1 hypothetical protein [Kibdelosporangium banguiense]